jgi:hypothetical protein
MSRTWAGEDRRHQAVYVIDAGTPLSLLGHVDGGYCSLVVGEDRGVVLRLSPAGMLRVVRLLVEAAES